MKRALLCMTAGIMAVSSFAAYTINPPVGRLAVVADGNSPDPDDIGATAASLGLLRSAGLQSRLVHYSHCCDLDPFLSAGTQTITEAQELNRHTLMQTSCDGTASRWGGFSGITFWNCRTQQSSAVSDLKDAINASTAADPLWIIEAGEPDIIGYALDAANSSARQYVKVITHHPANDDSGDYFTWQDILDYGVGEVRIGDQNVELKVSTNEWTWARDHSDSRINWIWEQGMIAEADPAVGFQHGNFDISDAGMTMYWITGANVNSGLVSPTVTDVKNLLEDYVDNGLDLDVTINAADFDTESDPANNNIIRDNGSNIGYIVNGSWVCYKDFDFNDGVERIDVSATTPNSGSIEVRTGSPTGTLLGTVNITTTGDWGTYQTFSANLSSTTGVKDLYFVFTGGTGGLFNLASFIIYPATSAVSIVEDSDASLVYTGNWITQNNTLDHGGSMRYGQSANDSVSLTFTGTEVNVGLRKGKYGGRVDIYIDGTLVANDVDTYADPIEYQRHAIFRNTHD